MWGSRSPGLYGGGAVARRRLNDVELGNVFLALSASLRALAGHFGRLADHYKAPPSDDDAPTGEHEVPWLALARRELGQREVPGPESNPRIQEYLRAVPLADARVVDETPWCSAFVNWCCREAGVLRSNSAAARSWLKVGEECDERKGAIAVLWRGSRHGWQGHVGFVVGWDATRVLLLGGNQGNAVSEKWYPKSRVLDYRWPVSR